MRKRTPGPWVKQDDLTRGRDPIGVLSDDGMEVVAQASSEANARLIAAAPDLLAALKDLVNRCDGTEGVLADGSNIQTRWAHAIIEKVEGGSHE